MSNFRQRKAFTIVEMVIVIAVIAVLAAVMIPTISGVINKANVSADQQFAASLNVQLAMWEVDNGVIDSESDLRDAINHYYGEDGTVDFYATLQPKSGKQGYHYWYDVESKKVILATCDELNMGRAIGDYTFSPANPRSLILGGKNYFLLDNGGSELGELFTKFATLLDASAYEEAISELNGLISDGNSGESTLAETIADKISKTTIITDGGAFRYEANDAAEIEFVWISPLSTNLQGTKVYVYDGTEVDDGQNSTKLAGDTVTDIFLPKDVTVSLGGLSAIKVDTYDASVLVRDYANTTKLHVNVEKVEDLEKIYTDCVLVMPNGAEYMYFGDKLYALPITINSESNLPTGDSVGSVDDSAMSIDGLDIDCLEAHTEEGKGKAFLYSDTVFVAYDKGGVQLSLTNDISNSMVIWESDNEALVTVDANGKVTFNSLPGTVANPDYDAKITATYKYDETKTAEITVYAVQPNVVLFKIGDKDASLINNQQSPISIDYNGENATQAIVIDKNTISHNSTTKFVTLEEGFFEYETTGGLFKVENNQLIIEPTAINGESSQTLTIKYKGATTGQVYLEATYTITIKDISTTPFEKNKVNGVEMGSEYLFRVGNDDGTTFTLSQLFSCKTPPADVVLNIYDASKYTEGTDVPISVGDSTTAFTVSVTGGTANDDGSWTLSGSNWGSATLDFDGTGVAIIEIDGVRLAVEVVNGKNVTSSLSSSANNVLLSDISLGSSAFTLNSGYTIWGNGFTINAETCNNKTDHIVLKNQATLDNVRIIGGVYTTLNDAYNTAYYAAVVRMEEGSTISNSYIANSRVPVRVDGNATIINSTFAGGRMANIELRAGTLILEDVTTINQANANDKASDGSTVVGLGIIVHSDAQSTANIVIKGDLIQHNFINEEDPLPDETRVNAAKDLMFNDSAFSSMRFTDSDGTVYANSGIVFLNGTQNLTGMPTNYKCLSKNVSALGKTVYIYSYDNTKYNFTADSLKYDTWAPEEQNVVKPVFSYTGLGGKPATLPTSYQYYDATYTYENGQVKYYGTIHLGSTSGKVTINNVLSGVNVSKYDGQDLVVNVETSGTKNGNAVEFSADGYITYKVTDTRFFDNNGNKVEGTSVVYEFTIEVKVEKTSLPKAVIHVPSGDGVVHWTKSNSGFAALLDPDYYILVPVLDGVVIKDDSGNVIQDCSGLTSVPAGLTITVTVTQSAGSAANLKFNGDTKTISNVLYYRSAGGIDNYHGSKNSTQTIITVTYSYSADGYQTAATVTRTFKSESGKNVH